MINKIKSFIVNEREEFLSDKFKYLLRHAIYFLMLIISFALPCCSQNKYHLVPLMFVCVQIILIFIYLLLYKNIIIDKQILSILLFCVTIIISSSINDITQIDKTEFALSFMFIAFYMFISIDENRNKNIFAIYFGLFIFALVFFFAYRKEIFLLQVGRLGEMFGNQNSMGHYFLLGYILNIYLAILCKKYILSISLPFFVILGALTGSKFFFFTFVIVTIVFIICLFGKKRWYLSALIIICGFLILLCLLQLSIFSTLKERLLNLLGFIKNSSASSDISSVKRFNMLFEGIYLFTFKPILGWGTNGFAINGAYGTYSHSSISELLCDFGVIGFICFFTPLFLSIFAKKCKDKKNLTFSRMLCTYLLLLFICTVTIDEKVYYFALPIACAFSNLSISNSDKSNNAQIVEKSKHQKSHQFKNKLGL